MDVCLYNEGTEAQRHKGTEGWGPFVSYWLSCPAFLCLILVTLLTGVLSSVASAGEDLAVIAEEGWGAFYGGREAVLHFRVEGETDRRILTCWKLSFNNRVARRGEMELSPGGGKNRRFEVRFMMPPVKSGVVMAGTIEISALAVDSGRPATVIRKHLRAFPENPFDGRTDFLQSLHIRLLDPEGRTAAVLQEAGIPFELLKDAESVSRLDEGLLIVGEGAVLSDKRMPAKRLQEAAQNGLRVLCLNPSEGMFSLPGSGSTGADPRVMGFRHADIITEMDKRLDADVWPPDGSIMERSLMIAGDCGAGAGVIVSGTSGWSWLDMTYPKGRFVICCFRIIDKWRDGPNAPFLLAGIIEHMGSKTAITDN